MRAPKLLISVPTQPPLEEKSPASASPSSLTDDTDENDLPPRGKRAVTWALVDCEEFSKCETEQRSASKGRQPLKAVGKVHRCPEAALEPPALQLPLSPRGGVPRPRGQLCCPRVTELLRAMRSLQGGKVEVRPQQQKRRAVANHPGRKGYLWKLNAAMKDNMGDLRSWRRRFFLLRTAERTKAALVYLSEKRDGEMTLACELTGSSQETVTSLPEVAVEEPDAETRFWVLSNLHQYDLAFGFDEGRGLDAYGDFLPEQLFPFSITWLDAEHQVQHSITLAAASEQVRDKWVHNLTRKQLALNEKAASTGRG